MSKEYQDRVYSMFRNQKLDTKSISIHFQGNEALVERLLHAAQEERLRLRAERESNLPKSPAPN